MSRSLLVLPLLLLLAGCGSKINETNYYRIGVGSSDEKVEEILGPGQPIDLPETAGTARTAKRWSAGELTVTILFENGRVIARRAEGLSGGKTESFDWPEAATRPACRKGGRRKTGEVSCPYGNPAVRVTFARVLRIEPNPDPVYAPGGAPPRGWFLVRGVRGVLRAFTGDFRAVPPIAFRRWLATLVIGFVASVTIVAGMTRWARAYLAEGTPLAERDALLLRWMADNGPVSFSNAILLESFGNLAYLVPVTILCFAAAARRRRPLLALGFVVIYVLQRLIVLTGWWMWDRARPDLIAAGIAAPGLHSFPSGHAALTFSTYGLLTWLWIRSTRNAAERAAAVVLFLLLVLAVGWSRVVLSTHWPSDIFAGWIAGFGWVATIIVAQVRAEHAGGR